MNLSSVDRSLGGILVPLFAMICLFPFVSSGTALFLGIAVALVVGNPYSVAIRPYISKLLGVGIVGLGASLDLRSVLQAGAEGLGYTVVGIALTFALGLWLGKKIAVPSETSLLITAGTAICGGSAIAAIAASIKARAESVSVALGTVFCLNAAALYLFPEIARALSLSPRQFGLWSALAIHDTSSVVGAALRYDPEALPIAATVKLARALWIAPAAFVIGAAWNRGRGGSESRRLPRPPWFLTGFLIAAAIVTFIPAMQPLGREFAGVAKRLFVLTLFLIGSGLTRSFLKSVGPRPLVLGGVLWGLVSAGCLAAIVWGWVV